MVRLTRTAYDTSPGRSPAELLDTEQFRTATDLEDHFLDGLAPAAYLRSSALGAGRRHRPLNVLNTGSATSRAT